MRYSRMPIEIESPEEMGYSNIRYNLAESSMRDINLRDLNLHLNHLTLFYGEHKGLLKLREAIINETTSLTPADVLVTTGAATALFIISTSLLNPTDHLIVIRPNYATNLETPRAINCELSIIDLRFENQFSIDVEEIREAIRPNTKLISITNPHNPTGKLFDADTIKQLISLAEEKNCRLLVDETYRDLNFQTALQPYFAELSPNVISVSSVSKSFGAPGIRIGWLICRDQKLMHDFLAAKEQICLCNSVVDEEIAFHLLHNKVEILTTNHKHIRVNFIAMSLWFSRQNYLEWIEPQAGVVCFPRLKAEYKIDAEKFYEALFANYATIVGPGHWFERERTYMRIGFGYPTLEELTIGLNNLHECLKMMAK